MNAKLISGSYLDNSNVAAPVAAIGSILHPSL